jgi:hypothetical protein
MDFMTEDSLIAYFLGALSESESRRLEEESLRNEDLFDQLHLTEESLIDAYVRDEMTLERRTSFERNYLNTQRRRETVALAKALIQKYNTAEVDSVRETAAAPVPAPWRGVLVANRVAWVSALAAVILLIIAAGLWTMWRRENAFSLQANGPGATPAPGATQSTTGASPTETVSQGQSVSPVPPPATTVSPSFPSPKNAPADSAQTSPVFATFTLLPGSLRSENVTGQILNLPSTVTIARLQLVLKENHFTSYRAELQTPEGATVLRRPRLNSTASGSHFTVVLDIPMHTLESRHYVVVLYSAEKSKTDEPAAEYAFKVNKQ